MVMSALIAAAIAVASPAPSESIADIVEVPDIKSLAVSPDGRFVAFRTEQPSISDNRIHLQWYVVPMNGSAPARPLADGGDAEIFGGLVTNEVPVWAPSSKAFYVRAAFHGAVQLWRIPIDGPAPAQVTQHPADIRAVTPGADGKSLSLEVGAPREKIAQEVQKLRDDGVLIDGSIDLSSALIDDSVFNGQPATLRFTKDWFIRRPILWDQDVHKEPFPLTGEDLATPGTPKSGQPLDVRIDQKGTLQELHWIDAQKVDHTCTGTDCPTRRISAAVVLYNGRDVLVTVTDSAREHTLLIWTPASNRWRTLLHSRGMINGGSQYFAKSCAIGFEDIACVAADPSGPPRLITVNLATGRTRQLFDPSPSLRVRAWPTREVRWTTSQGIEIGGQLLLPRGPAPKSGFPLVVDYYDCTGFQRGGVGDELPLAPLAEAGIATLCINQAWSIGQDFVWKVAAGVDAVSSGIEYLGREGIIDKSRVGMTGLSFGESVTTAVLERTPLLRAASIASADMDPVYWWAASVPGRDIKGMLWDQFRVGNPDTQPEGWKAITAIGGLANLHAPLLMQLPESETRLAIEFYGRLASSPTPTELYSYPNEMHVKWEPRHKLAVYQRNLDWFRFWLLGQEDSDPAKAGQYARWRAFSARPGYALPVQNHTTP